VKDVRLIFVVASVGGLKWKRLKSEVKAIGYCGCAVVVTILLRRVAVIGSASSFTLTSHIAEFMESRNHIEDSAPCKNLI
jgi:hypothetical protein